MEIHEGLLERKKEKPSTAKWKVSFLSLYLNPPKGYKFNLILLPSVNLIHRRKGLLSSWSGSCDAVFEQVTKGHMTNANEKGFSALELASSIAVIKLLWGGGYLLESNENNWCPAVALVMLSCFLERSSSGFDDTCSQVTYYHLMTWFPTFTCHNCCHEQICK